MAIKICVVCNKEFIADPRRTVCSMDCYSVYRVRTRIPKTCLFCQKHFTVCPSEESWKRHCSDDCKQAYLKEQFNIEFWKRVHKTNGCWLWTGSIRSKEHPYGDFKFDGNRYQAHRLSYEMAYGSIPEGLFVCHHCDNPSCVHPDHLFLGTNLDNIKDKTAKGRSRGPARQITDEQVQWIREQYAQGKNIHWIARQLGRNESHVRDIAQGRARKR